jgi:hypothetical protein
MAFTGFPILNPMSRDEFVKKAREVVMRIKYPKTDLG